MMQWKKKNHIHCIPNITDQAATTWLWLTQCKKKKKKKDLKPKSTQH